MGSILDDLDGIPGASHVKKNRPSSSSNSASGGYNNRGVSNWNTASPKYQEKEDPVAYIRGISGEYNDKRIIIHEGDTYTFGRSPENHISFSPDARGVSRLHLCIQSVASEKKVILVDIDSSYGTYDGTKRRFVSNHPYELHQGDVFTFGYNQMFKVEFE